jgi:hypothetical protein
MPPTNKQMFKPFVPFSDMVKFECTKEGKGKKIPMWQVEKPIASGQVVFFFFFPHKLC